MSHWDEKTQQIQLQFFNTLSRIGIVLVRENLFDVIETDNDLFRDFIARVKQYGRYKIHETDRDLAKYFINLTKSTSPLR